MFCTADRLLTVTRRSPRVTAAVTPPNTGQFSFDDVLDVWRNSQRSSPGTSFVEVPAVERPDFWPRPAKGGFEPPRVIVPGTGITASALFENRSDADESARVWLSAFVWQWRRQRGVHPPDVVRVLADLHDCFRAEARRGNGYHGNTQQTLPLWHVPIDGRRWNQVVASAARGKVTIEQRYVVVVPSR